MRTWTKLPDNLGPIHFVGIGGIGMSGIAEVLINLGYKVQGSDLSKTDITKRFVDAGAKIFHGQSSDNIAGADVVVVSSAIRNDNPELVEARRRGLPVVRRAEMLAELMRLKSNVAVAGTHGKTTTTTMVATLLEFGGFDPTVVNGGIIRSFGSNARKGEGEWMVVEADESDGTFVKLPATVAVVTNIDPEHLDHYGDFEKLKSAFDHFISNVPFYGFAVCCTDHPEVQALVGRLTDRRVITFGFNPQADVGAENLRYIDGNARFDIDWRAGGMRLEDCTLPMPGDHNVSNSLGAAAVARGLGMEGGQIREALANFAGVKRRFTRVGRRNGAEIIDDYAHHPAEISAVLKASRQASSGRVLAIHQPHRYTRLANLFDDFCTCFNDADVVAIADVYAAGEESIPGADKENLVAGLKRHGHRRAMTIAGEEDLRDFVDSEAGCGDIVVCMGAGTITSWANSIVDDSEGS